MVYKWSHWQKPDNIALDEFDPFNEASNIELFINGQDRFCVVSKSIGTLVTTILFSRQRDKFVKAVLCGIPLNSLSEKWKSEYKTLQQVREKEVSVIQNEFDPTGSFELVSKFIEKINPDLFVLKKDGVDTHDYFYISDIKKLLSR